jgi:hypothetical protein
MESSMVQKDIESRSGLALLLEESVVLQVRLVTHSRRERRLSLFDSTFDDVRMRADDSSFVFSQSLLFARSRTQLLCVCLSWVQRQGRKYMAFSFDEKSEKKISLNNKSLLS